MNKFLVFLLVTFCPLFALDNFTNEIMEKIQKKYGENSQSRFVAWDNLIAQAKQADTLNKLKLVNDFFNTIKYMTDMKHWNEIDYWASPIEFTGSGAGDCEDYAIAKYFTLIKVGIPESKLKITYVKLLRANTQFEEAHMVLTYYHQSNSIPIVLDNVNKKLALASEREDLKPIYSFNANGLWEAKNKGKEDQFVGENKMSKWKDLINKM